MQHNHPHRTYRQIYMPFNKLHKNVHWFAFFFLSLSPYHAYIPSFSSPNGMVYVTWTNSNHFLYFFGCEENKNNKFQFVSTHLLERNENQMIRHNFRRDLSYTRRYITCIWLVCNFSTLNVFFSSSRWACFDHILLFCNRIYTQSHSRKLCIVQMKQGHTHTHTRWN